jgi:hypothetical protein
MSLLRILDRTEPTRQDFGQCQPPKRKALPQHLGACTEPTQHMRVPKLSA